MNISIDIVKMEFNLMFLWCKKIIHIFFDLYEGIGGESKIINFISVGYSKILNYQIFSKKNNIYRLPLIKF